MCSSTLILIDRYPKKMIDLKQHLNNTVLVHLRNGISCITKVSESSRPGDPYVLEDLPFGDVRYSSDGSYWLNDSSYDVYKIELPRGEEAIKLYKDQIERAEDKLRRLKRNLEEVKRQELFNQKLYTPIESDRGLKALLKLLKDEGAGEKLLSEAFCWEETPQGEPYWCEKAYNGVALSKEDLQCFRKWIVNYLIVKEG